MPLRTAPLVAKERRVCTDVARHLASVLDAHDLDAMLRAVEIVLVRHAESIWNAENRWQGQTDIPLSEHGREEARKLGVRLASLSFDRRLCSDLSRTRETAAAIGGAFEFDPSLREMDLGRWGGMLHTEVREKHPEELEALASGAPTKIGGGESVPEFEARTSAALRLIVQSSRSDDRVLVVTHGGVIRALVMELLGARARRPLIGATNTSITHLRIDASGGTKLVAYNCSDHLDPSQDADDEVASGPPDEVIRRTLAHLGLASQAAERLCPPREGTFTRLARTGREPSLRSFAIPALGAL